MATYFVEINAKFLVKLEYDGSACGAEHYFLDGYKACWGANAYDEKTMKTDCFRGALLTSEIVSLKELDTILKRVDRAQEEVGEYDKGLKLIEEELAKIQAQYDEVKDRYLHMSHEAAEARKVEEQFREEAAAQPRFKA